MLALTLNRGLSKIGAATALINSGLKGKSLKHCISVAGAEIAIVGSSVLGAVAEVMPELPNVEWNCWRGEATDGMQAASGVKDFDAVVESMSTKRPPASVRQELRTLTLTLTLTPIFILLMYPNPTPRMKY